MDVRRRIQRAIHTVLTSIGFIRRGQTWRLETEDLWLVVNLQGDGSGGGYYVNVGIYLKLLGQDVEPAEHLCHLRARAERLWLERYDEYCELFWFDCVLAEERHLDALVAVVESTMGHTFRRVRSVPELRSALREWEGRRQLLTVVSAQAFLGVDYLGVPRYPLS